MASSSTSPHSWATPKDKGKGKGKAPAPRQNSLPTPETELAAARSLIDSLLERLAQVRVQEEAMRMPAWERAMWARLAESDVLVRELCGRVARAKVGVEVDVDVGRRRGERERGEMVVLALGVVQALAAQLANVGQVGREVKMIGNAEKQGEGEEEEGKEEWQEMEDEEEKEEKEEKVEKVETEEEQEKAELEKEELEKQELEKQELEKEEIEKEQKEEEAETIEDRVARIKRRVRELTGGLETLGEPTAGQASTAQPPAPSPPPSLSPAPTSTRPPLSLKFSFSTSAYYMMTATLTSALNPPETFFPHACLWTEVCPPTDISTRSLRHSHHTFLVPGGGSALQVFTPPFAAPPIVVMWLTGIRLAPGRPWNVRCRAADTTAAGFTAVVESWDGAALEAAGVAWMAYEREKTPGIWSAPWTVAEEGGVSRINRRDGEVKILGKRFRRFPRAVAGVTEVVAEGVGGDTEMTVWASGWDEKVKWWVAARGESTVLRVGCVGVVLGEYDE